MTEPTADRVAEPAPEPERVARRDLLLAQVARSLPDLTAVGVAAFASVCVAALLLERFQPAIVLGVGSIAAAAAMAVLGLERARQRNDELPAPDTDIGRRDGPQDVVATALVLLGACVWLYVAMRLSGEFLYTWRDPGAYLNAGRWLVDHPSLAIDPQPEVFGNVPGLNATSLAFGNADGDVQAQGYHLLPALLAVGAWLVGDPNFVLDVNPIIGALALVVSYGLGRRIAGPWWGILVPATLAASMPFVAFTRDPYTEPLALLLLLGSMSLLWRAVDSGRYRDFVLAGLTAGAGCLVRVDAYLTFLAFGAGLVVITAFANPDRRRRLAVGSLLALLGASVPVVLGVLDVSELSTPYWHDLTDDTRRLAIVGALLLVLGPIIVAVVWRDRVRAWLARHANLFGWIMAAAVLIVVAVMATRPWWWVSHQNNPPGFELLKAFQRSLGLPEEPTRSYEELSLSWLSWYYGWPAVALGTVGIALLVRRLAFPGDFRLAYPLIAFLGSGLLYLNQASIFPDQIWAMRRYLPVVIPGMLVGCAALCAILWSRHGIARLGAVLAAGLTIGITVYSLWPMARVPSFRPQLTEVTAVCEALPDDAALLTVDNAGQLRGTYQQTFRGFCGVPTIGLETPTSQVLAEVAAAARSHGRTLYVASIDPAAVPWADDAADPTDVWITTRGVKWPERLLEPPGGPNFFDRGIYLGVVQADGTVDVAPPPLDTTLDPSSDPADVIPAR